MAEYQVEQYQQPEYFPVVDRLPCFGVRRPRQRERQGKNDGQRSSQNVFRGGFAGFDLADDDGFVAEGAFAGAASRAACGVGDLHEAALSVVGQAEDSAAACFDTASASRAVVGAEYDFGVFHLR